MGLFVVNISELSFVTVTENVKDFWVSGQTGDWTKDNEIGRARADELLALIASTCCPAYLVSVAQAIAKSGNWSGVEAGFFTRIATQAVA